MSTIKNCPKHGPYRSRYDPVLGITVHDYVSKKSVTESNDSPCSRTKPLRDKGLTELIAGGRI